MNDKSSHPIRNGIIIAVTSGVILSFWPAFRAAVTKSALWLWGLIVGGWNYLWQAHAVYGWLLVILVFLSLPTIVQIVRKLRKEREPDHTDVFKRANLFGAIWHWRYINGSIDNQWCLCPQCQSELVYSEFIPDRFNIDHAGLPPKTNFVCERCRTPRASIEGDKSYALASVEREIRRRIRTGEWKQDKSS